MIYRISADCEIYPIYTKKFLLFCNMGIENFIPYNQVRYIRVLRHASPPNNMRERRINKNAYVSIFQHFFHLSIYIET